MPWLAAVPAWLGSVAAEAAAAAAPALAEGAATALPAAAEASGMALAEGASAALPAAAEAGGMALAEGASAVAPTALESAAPMLSEAVAQPMMMTTPLEAPAGAFSTGAPSSEVMFHATPEALMNLTSYQLPVDTSMPTPPSGFGYGGEFATGAPPAASPHVPGVSPHTVSPASVNAGQPISAASQMQNPSMVNSLRSFWDKYGNDIMDLTKQGFGGDQEQEQYPQSMPGYDPTLYNEYMMRLGRLGTVGTPLPGLEWFYGQEYPY